MSGAAAVIGSRATFWRKVSGKRHRAVQRHHIQDEERVKLMGLTVQRPGEHALTLLPLLEEDVPWLAGLAHQIMSKVERVVAGEILAPRSTEQASPLEGMPGETLVVVPFSRHSHLSGTSYLQLLGCEALLREKEPSLVARPQPMLSEFLPLSLVGGWSGTSHAGIKAQVIACPGWDTDVMIAGPVGVLRHPTRTTRSSDPELPQWLHHIYTNALPPSMDANMYAAYLTQTLVQTLFLIQNIVSRRTHA